MTKDNRFRIPLPKFSWQTGGDDDGLPEPENDAEEEAEKLLKEMNEQERLRDTPDYIEPSLYRQGEVDVLKQNMAHGTPNGVYNPTLEVDEYFEDYIIPRLRQHFGSNIIDVKTKAPWVQAVDIDIGGESVRVLGENCALGACANISHKDDNIVGELVEVIGATGLPYTELMYENPKRGKDRKKNFVHEIPGYWHEYGYEIQSDPHGASQKTVEKIYYDNPMLRDVGQDEVMPLLRETFNVRDLNYTHGGLANWKVSIKDRSGRLTIDTGTNNIVHRHFMQLDPPGHPAQSEVINKIGGIGLPQDGSSTNKWGAPTMTVWDEIGYKIGSR